MSPTRLANKPANVLKACQIMGIEGGGQSVPSSYTPTETAKLDNFGLKVWLRDVLSRLADHPANRIADLLPQDFACRRYCIRFDDGFVGETVYKAKTGPLTKLRDSDDTEFLYTYDLRDNFEHRIEVLDLFEASAGSRLPVFLGGKLRTPQDAVRWSPGFEIFLETINHPAHEDFDHLVDS